MGNICVGGSRMTQHVNSPHRANAPSRGDHPASEQKLKAKARDQNLTSRLQKKIDDLKPQLRHASGPLKKYAQEAINRASGKKTTVSFAALDAEHLNAMVDVENQRNPGLNLRHFDNQLAFVEALKHDEPASFRAVLPQTSPNTNRPVKHHVIADVRLRPGYPPSVVITEAAVTVGFRNQQLHQHNLTLEAMNESGIPLSRVAIIETQAQKTSDDCVMYSLHYAIKAHKNAQQFDEIHQDLQQGAAPASRESRARTTLGALEKNMGHTVLHEGTHAAFGADVLPADFYKHGASLTQATELVNRPDGRLSGRVNSQGHDEPENLVQRNQAFRVTRKTFSDNAEPSTIQFSASIDGFRLQEIERVLAAASD